MIDESEPTVVTKREPNSAEKGAGPSRSTETAKSTLKTSTKTRLKDEDNADCTVVAAPPGP